MPRTARASVGGICYHVLNRGNRRDQVFLDDADYEYFLTLVGRACERHRMRVLDYCLMSNHFHLVLWPHGDGDLGRWMHALMTPQVRRYNLRHRRDGHVWGGRFKAFPVQDDEHLTTVLRYVERNPLRAGLVTHAAAWPWSSLRWWRQPGRPEFLHPIDTVMAKDWPAIVDEPQTDAELEGLRRCVSRGTPYGDSTWVRRIAAKLNLEFTLNPVGRPRKSPK